MPRFLDSKDVAQRYGVDTVTVWDWVRSGKLSAIRLGRRFLFTEEDLQAFEDKRRIEAKQ